MTMTQKILAAHAGLKEVTAGQLITCKLDLVHGNDITTPVAVNVFKNIGVDHVFDKEKVSIVPDHFVPNKDIKSAEQCKYIREFAHKMGIVNFFEVGQMGIEHALLPEKGLVVAGDDELLQIHYHTNEPWDVLKYCRAKGEIFDIVVEDMDRQSRGLKG